MKIFFTIVGLHSGQISRRKIRSLPILLPYIILSWDEYNFSYPYSNNRFPHKHVEGKTKFSICIGIFYWSIAFIFYKPEPFRRQSL